MADLEGLCVQDLTVDLKLLRDVLQIFFLIGHKSLWYGGDIGPGRGKRQT